MCKSRKRFLTDVAEAREDSAGFIVGKPDNFPLFSAIGGFGPMQDIEKGDCELYFFSISRDHCFLLFILLFINYFFNICRLVHSVLFR